MEKTARLSGRLIRHIGYGLGMPLLCLLPFLSGCNPNHNLDHEANQSLVEIGERSLEEAEALEKKGRIKGAHRAYRKAQWAFNYYEQLTGEQPFLAEEAQGGVERTR